MKENAVLYIRQTEMTSCEKIRQEYEELKTLKREFDLEFERAVKEGGDLTRAKELKAELEEKRDALKEKLDPYTGWQRYENGERIMEYKGELDDWSSHPKGVVIKKGDELLLNGKELLYKGKLNSWSSHPKGVVIKKGDELLLNGKELLYKGEWDSWSSHPKGVVIQKGDELLLNGKELLYKGKWNGWRPHPKGVVIRKGDEWFFYNQSVEKM